MNKMINEMLIERKILQCINETISSKNEIKD